MRNCKNCYWCQASLSGRKRWKCKYDPKKRFNHATIHGWACSNHTIDPDSIDVPTSVQYPKRYRALTTIIVGAVVGIFQGIYREDPVLGVLCGLFAFVLNVTIYVVVDWWTEDE